jgi:hypothetical protein
MTSSNGKNQGTEPAGPPVSPLAVVAVVIVLLLFTAVATPEAFIWLRRTGLTRVVLPDTPVVANYLLVALSLSFVIAALIIRLMMVSRRTANLQAQKAPWWSRLLAFAVLMLCLKLAISSNLLRRRLGELSQRFARATPTASPTESVIHVPPHTTSRPLGVALTVLIALVLCLTVAGIVFLLARVKGEVAPPMPEDPLIELLDAGIDDLRRIPDPRRAVIACYARMEHLMSSSGIPRLLSDTPTEFLARVLQHRSVSAESASMLTTLFEQAKFSPHRVDEQMREEALVALERVRDELALV